jgi:cytochrome c biogenesis protein CcmG/thiol:disulfide interchange protein DsbE
MYKWIPLIIAIGLALVLYTAIGKDPTKLETARLNDPVPEFDLSQLENDAQRITQDKLKGQPMLLNVWATWCPSCRVEHDYLLQLSQAGVPIVGLNYKDERPAALEWLKRLGNPYQFNIFDPQGKLGFDLGVYGAPETYLIDKDGYVRYRHVGVVDMKVWMSTLEPIYLKLLQ